MDWDDIKDSLGRDVARLESELKDVREYYEKQIEAATQNEILSAIKTVTAELGKIYGRIAALETKLSEDDE